MELFTAHCPRDRPPSPIGLITRQSPEPGLFARFSTSVRPGMDPHSVLFCDQKLGQGADISPVINTWVDFLTGGFSPKIEENVHISKCTGTKKNVRLHLCKEVIEEEAHFWTSLLIQLSAVNPQ